MRFDSPTPEMVKDARAESGITQKEASAMLHTSIRAYQQWESGARKMHATFWELFTLKLKAHNGN